jgi:hypothetical protein
MPPEGMVHALRRASELLQPDGVLIDLHPTPDAAELSVVRPDGAREAIGPLHSETATQRHANADAAIETALEEGFLARTAADSFVFARYSDSLDQLNDYVTTKWTARFDEATLTRARSALRPESTLRLQENVSISALRPASRAARLLPVR